jgi:anthranilate phosphoribosyltransferase
VILLNAGAAIYVSGEARSIEEGVRQAERSIGDGAALSALDDFVHTTRRLAGLGGPA